MTPEVDIAFDTAKAALESARRCLAAEIRRYPTPISGCDAQFNHLLSQRSQVNRAIDALQTTVFIPTPRSPTPVSRVESR